MHPVRCATETADSIPITRAPLEVQDACPWPALGSRFRQRGGGPAATLMRSGAMAAATRVYFRANAPDPTVNIQCLPAVRRQAASNGSAHEPNLSPRFSDRSAH